MPNPVVGGVGAAALGYLGSKKAASATTSAANTQAATTLQAANIQAELAREAARRQEVASIFRPVGLTTGFGSAQYTVGPGGYLSSVGYTLTPELQAQRDRLMGALGGELDTALATDQYYADIAGRYRGMGEEALAGIELDPMQAAAERTARLEALAAPGRAEARERLFSGLAAKGLTGLATETGTGDRGNPYMAALAAEEERQRALTAAQSYDLSRRDIAADLLRAEGLFGAGQQAETYQAGRLAQAMSPYQTLLSQAQTIEGLGGSVLEAGMGYSESERQSAFQGAGAAARGLTSAGSAIGTGMTTAAQIQADAARANAQRTAALYGGIGSTLGGLDYSGLFGPSAATQRGLTIARNDPYAIGGTFGD